MSKFEGSIFFIIFSTHIIETPESQSETKEMEIRSSTESTQRTLTLSYSDTMRKKETACTNF